ncbi:MAG: PASTA domain-containing protein, partial [Treponemataceae bacterium]|nr:PASTA domain-containing protein [Treponemataceae bacterium]
VKGYSRVSLVVSRGVVVDSVGSYVGRTLDEVRLHLQTVFAGSARPLIVLGEPSYKADVSEAGTILAQDPPEGTDISEPVVVKLVVSRGPSFENTRVPSLAGKSVMELLQLISTGRIVYDCTARAPADGEVPGTVVGQSAAAGEFVRNYARVGVELALPSGVYNDNLYGIFSASLTVYPYPVPMRLDVVSDGATTTLASFLHPGGSLAVPYAVPKNSTLVLFVNGKEAAKTAVH